MTDLKISLPHTSYPPAEPAPDHALNEPSRTQSFLQGAILGDYNEHSTTSSFLGQVATGFIPGVGQLADLRDTIKAGEDVLADKPGAWAALGLAAVAWVPGVGDAVKAYAKAPVSVSRAVVDAASSASKWARESASQGIKTVLTRAPRLSKWLYRPGVQFADRLPDDALGITLGNGDIFIKRGMSAEQTLETYYHEKVHQSLSPKFRPLLKWRAERGFEAYDKLHFFRYAEEALAETVSQIRVKGISWSSIKDGLAFPIQNNYRIRPSAILKEAVIGSSLYASLLSGSSALGRAFSTWWHEERAGLPQSPHNFSQQNHE